MAIFFCGVIYRFEEWGIFVIEEGVVADESVFKNRPSSLEYCT